jgi:hypothetical protein
VYKNDFIIFLFRQYFFYKSKQKEPKRIPSLTLVNAQATNKQMSSKRKQSELCSGPNAIVSIDLTQQQDVKINKKEEVKEEEQGINSKANNDKQLLDLFESLRLAASEELTIPDWEESWGEVTQWPDESKPCYNYSSAHLSSQIKKLIHSIELQLVYGGASLPKNLHEKYSKEISMVCDHADVQFRFEDNKAIFKKCLEQFGLESFHWLGLVVYGCMNDSKKVVSDLIKLVKPLIKPSGEKMSTFCNDHVNVGGYMDPFITKMKNIDMDFLVSFLQATTLLPHNQSLLYRCTSFSLPPSVEKALNKKM